MSIVARVTELVNRGGLFSSKDLSRTARALSRMGVKDPMLTKSLFNWCEGRMDTMHPREVAETMYALGRMTSPSNEDKDQMLGDSYEYVSTFSSA